MNFGVEDLSIGEFMRLAPARAVCGSLGRAEREISDIDNDNCEGEDESKNYRNRQLSAGDCRDKR